MYVYKYIYIYIYIIYVYAYMPLHDLFHHVVYVIWGCIGHDNEQKQEEIFSLDKDVEELLQCLGWCQPWAGTWENQLEMDHRLVVNMFYCFHTLGILSSQVTSPYFFRGVGIPPTFPQMSNLRHVWWPAYLMGLPGGKPRTWASSCTTHGPFGDLAGNWETELIATHSKSFSTRGYCGDLWWCQYGSSLIFWYILYVCSVQLPSY